MRASQSGPQFQRCRHDARDQQQQNRRRYDALLQEGQCQRTVGNEFALRDENDPRDGEDENEGQCEEGIDGPVDEAILREQQYDVETQDSALPAMAPSVLMPAYFGR